MMTDEANEVDDQESYEGYVAESWAGSASSQSGVRTFFVFIDLPQHLEFRVAEMPILNKGTELELDMSLRHPRNPKKVRKIAGVYTVVRRVLRYTSSRPSTMGLSQYLELMAGPAPQ